MHRQDQSERDRRAGPGGRHPATSRHDNARVERTMAALYAEARRRDIPGRSKMNKAALERALG